VQDLSHTVVQLREMQQQVKGGGMKGKEGKWSSTSVKQKNDHWST
jgi:hypothetical protein